MPTKGFSVLIRDNTGNETGLYEKSHALLIGVSDYTGGWPDLESVLSELDKLESVLKKQGFNTVKVINPDSKTLKKSFNNFIDQYGYNVNDRLLFFYSGHGYSRKNGKKGYLVPADAPDPRKYEKGFLQKSLEMGQIMTWSRQIESKHALFLFDSCFSGTIFKTKTLPEVPPPINSYTINPVRQFITAGSAGEEVPAFSVFTPSLVRALKGDADLNDDGYITGTELGMYLVDKVMKYNTAQTPQYGKIRDPDLDRGDFVFVVKKKSANKDEVLWKTIENSTLTEDFEFFLKMYPDSRFASLAIIKIRQIEKSKEDSFWNVIKNSSSILDFEDYLAAYPKGKYTNIARIKIRQLKRNKDDTESDSNEESYAYSIFSFGTSIAFWAGAVVKYQEAVYLTKQAEETAKTEPIKSKEFAEQRNEAANMAFGAALTGTVIFILGIVSYPSKSETVTFDSEWKIRPLIMVSENNNNFGIRINIQW